MFSSSRNFYLKNLKLLEKLLLQVGSFTVAENIGLVYILVSAFRVILYVLLTFIKKKGKFNLFKKHEIKYRSSEIPIIISENITNKKCVHFT